MKRKLCVFTGTRADYGLLKPLLEEIKSDLDLQLQLIVCGMHLMPEFGLTYREIENDGFAIDKKIDFNLDSDTSLGIAKSMGITMEKMAEAYKRLKPDLLVGLGDRFELLSAVAAALVCRLPVAHISGGDITEGVIDDSFRHAITKMSHLHFTATEASRKRVIQLGESPARVFNVGEMGLDNIKKMDFISKEELERYLNFKFGRRNLLVTFHPLTLEVNKSQIYFKNLLEVLDELEGTTIIFTKANADMEGRTINRMIDEYVSQKPGKSVAFASLGRRRYLSAMRLSSAVVGNSSSGIVEAPSLNIATINIGDRQKGRESAKSVITCEVSKAAIREAFNKLSSKAFSTGLKNVRNPFGDGKSAKRVKRILKGFNLKNIIRKKFFDVEVKE